MTGPNMLRAMMIALGWMVIAIGASASPPLETYAKLPDFEMAAISPSGKRVAVVGIFENQRKLVVIEDEKSIFSRNIGDDRLRALNWAGEDKMLLTSNQTIDLGRGFTADRAEVSRVSVVSIDGKPVWQIFADSKQVSSIVRGFYGVYERGGTCYGYFGGITLRQGAIATTVPELYEVNLETRQMRVIAKRSGDAWRNWVVGADGSVPVTLETYLGGRWALLNAEQQKIATGKARDGYIGLIGLGRTPNTVVYSEGNDESGARILEQSLAGGPPTEILNDAEIRRYYGDRRTGLLIGYAADKDVPEDIFFDQRAATVIAATRKAFPGRTLTLIDRNEDFDRLIVTTSGPGDPGSWWLVDKKAGTARDLSVSYAIAADDIGPMRMIRYKAADGLEIAGVLTLPPGREAKKLPVIVMPHDGPRGRSYPVFDWWVQAFASRGYAVFQPNFRGSGGSGSAFVRAGWGEFGRRMQTDMSDGLAEIARQGIVDPKRACIVGGGGYGGYAALAGVTLQQGVYQCAVSIAGISDVRELIGTSFRESGNIWRLIAAFKKGVGEKQDGGKVSPIEFAASANAPVMLIHRADDIAVPLQQSADMAAALIKARKPAEFVKVAGEEHSPSLNSMRIDILKTAVGFVEKYNPPDAAK